MARIQERLELLSGFGDLDLTVAASSGNVDRRVVVGVRLPATDSAAKRLLFWAVASGDKMAALTFLGSVGALDRTCLDRKGL